MPMYYYDATYVLVLVGAIICMIASANVNRTYKKYSKHGNAGNYTACQVAAQILRNAGIYDVSIEHVRGDLTDHYDPKAKVLRLSDSVYHSSSVAAIGVAAHECGHAIQDQVNYAPIRVRNAIVPVVNFSSKFSWVLIVAGLIFSLSGLVNLGVILFVAVVIFQLVTLPVEFDASRRALRILEGDGILYGEEISGARKVLTAAALTYVAATVNALLQLLRLVLISRRSND